MRRLLIGMVTCLLLAGCGGGGGDDGGEVADDVVDETPPVVDMRPVTEFCDDWHTLRAGDRLQYTYENNVWHKIDITDYEQCLLRRGEGADVQYGWRWRWPAAEEMGRKYDVKTFPNVFYGHHPWYDASTDAAMPVRVGDVTEFDVDYDISLDVEGTYNMAFQLWVTNGPVPSPETRTHEIMIWVAHNFLPMGHDHAQYFAHEVEIDGVTWDLYLRDDFVSGIQLGDNLAHQFAAFAIQEGEQFVGTIDVAQFIDHLVQIAHLSEDAYLSHLAFGNEVIEGTGTLWVNDYQVNLPSASDREPVVSRGNVGVGSRFVVDFTLPDGTVLEFVYTATGRTEHRGRAVYVVEESFGGAPTGNTTYYDVQTNNEAARLTNGEIHAEFVPHEGRVRYPLEVGRTYRNPYYFIGADVEGDWWVEWEIQAQEELTIGAETYTAYQIAVVDTKGETLNDADVYWVADVMGVAMTLKGDFYSAAADGRIQFRVVEFELMEP